MKYKIKITTPHQYGDIVDNYILGFQGKHRFLSNFYPASITIDNFQWPTTQHYYQAMKTNDLNIREIIRNLKTPHETKQYGKNITPPSNWHDISLDIMYKAVLAKFSQYQNLKERLLNTKDLIIIECNNWGDTFWGMTYNSKTEQYIGENKIGQILMKVREQLKK